MLFLNTLLKPKQLNNYMNSISLLFRVLFLSMISFLLINTLYSQEQRLEFNAGFGPALDAIHAGFNFKVTRKVSFGLSFGTIPDKLDFNNHVKVGFETKYNFGQSKTIKRRSFLLLITR